MHFELLSIEGSSDMIGILLCALYYGGMVGVAYYFAFAEVERRTIRPQRPARPPAPANAPEAAPEQPEAEGNLPEEMDEF